MERSEQEIFDELVVLCTSAGYAHAIAYFCFRDNLIVYKKQITPYDMSKLYGPNRLIRTEISTIIGLMCKADIDYSLPTQEILQIYITKTEELLNELHHSMMAPWIKDFNPENIQIDGFKPFASGPSLREPIFYGPESAYAFQYRDMALRKYDRDADWLLTNKGFDIKIAQQVIKSLGALQNKIQSSVYSYNEQNAGKFETMQLPAFVFTSEQLSEEADIDVKIVQSVLDAFSVSPKYRNETFKSLHDFNGLVATPIIQIDEKTYLNFQEYSLVAALYEAPIYWMCEDRNYKTKAFHNRGQFTEDFAYDCLRKVFGEKHVFANVHVEEQKGKERGEIDVLVLFGGRAILVQAKSKRLTMESKKGNDLQIKDDFKKAVQDSYDQAFDCAKALLAGNCKLYGGDGVEIQLPVPLVQIYPLCIVADHYPALDFQARQFLQATTTDIIAPPLVTDVFALDVIAEMLETPLRVLSYFNLRAQFGHKLMVSHELTLLSDHIQRNLHYGNSEYDMIMLGDDMAADLDSAMSVRRDGLQGKRTPDGILTRFRTSVVGQLVDQLERSASKEMTDLGLLLLELSENTIATLSLSIEKLTAMARDSGGSHDFTMSFKEGSSGITVHCVQGLSDEVIAKLERHCETRKYSTKADSWYGIIYYPDGQLALCARVEYPWQYSEPMEQFIKTLPKATTKAELLQHLRPTGKLGRNNPCHCGSGRKYKKCCLNRFR
ncbi:MAG: SEC-C domain-containing protein [Asticcacaulis sp.]|uniref:SEC-C metal-binding domain-containing protein n=1 Tax=Asticcacaulis sp. TaxID=1872648 RepID=UPI0025BA4C50|nr:SEC-C metal-binding domain-containing protein [Asticcacaulis sp.]MCA1936991.1 SEC-C domain-containing protein [Asticcacaulis sp.]